MYEYRVTKYDPKHRDPSGAYTLDEWTDFSDVGSAVGMEEYERVEEAYVSTAHEILQAAQVKRLVVTALDDAETESDLREGLVLLPQAWPAAFRAVLRNTLWCRFESPTGFVHFGWDFYMYVGTRLKPRPVPPAELTNGLFVEPFPTPYREHNG